MGLRVGLIYWALRWASVVGPTLFNQTKKAVFASMNFDLPCLIFDSIKNWSEFWTRLGPNLGI